MKHSMILALSLAAASISLGAPAVAHADATCPPLMTGHFDWDANGPSNLIRFQNIAYVYVTDGGAWTMWSGGQVFWNGGVGGTDLLKTGSPMKQYFSDRQSSGQPFFAGATDLNTITGISRDGTITMHNNTWNFDTTVNATCVGHSLTARLGNDLLILTLNDASTPR
jgi:hypothetical protein